MKFIVLLLLMGILLNSAYAVDFLNSDLDEDSSPESSEDHSDRLSVLVNTAMELMGPEALENESQDQMAQTTN